MRKTMLIFLLGSLAFPLHAQEPWTLERCIRYGLEHNTGIRLDEIGMAWIIDRENGVVWHNGGTGDYNSYLGFSPETGTAVVILSNLSPSYRIPATVLGVKLLSELSG